jgi:hypothetical protein
MDKEEARKIRENRIKNIKQAQEASEIIKVSDSL